MRDMVVVPDPTPEWEKKFVSVHQELDKQLLRGRRELGKEIIGKSENACARFG